MTRTDAAPTGQPPKTALHCSACDRSVPIADTELAGRDDRTEIRCPACGAVLVSQPRFGSGERRSRIVA